MDLLSLISHRWGSATMYARERDDLERWWRKLDKTQPVTRADLAQLVEAQRTVLFRLENHEVSTAAYLEGEQVSIRGALRRRVLGWIQG